MRSVRLRTPAKINLFFRVLGSRADGYHEIESLFQAIDLCDELVINETRGPSTLEVPGRPELEIQDNLVWRALRWIEKQIGSRLSVSMRLTKNIPVAAGLGGGSSDGAAALLGIRTLFDLELSDDDLFQGALRLGADAPFFLMGGAAIGEGIGEQLTPVELPTDYGIVLVNPGFPVSTRTIYSEFHKTLTGPSKQSKLRRILTKARDPRHLLHNDFQPIVERLHPTVKQIRLRLEHAGVPRALMTGSGPTVFGLYDSETDRLEKARTRLPDRWLSFVAKPLDKGIATD